MKPIIRPDPNPISGGGLMIRAYDSGFTGATAFFRNRSFIETFLNSLQELNQDVRILVHACSIGAEVWSLAAWWYHKIEPQTGFKLQIVAVDIDKFFLSYAQESRYPLDVLKGMSPEERSWFIIKTDHLTVPESLKEMVTFIEAASFIDFSPSHKNYFFDAVTIMNALTYVTPAEQTATIKNIASYTRHAICLTAFHPDQIFNDMSLIGFHPLMLNHQKIHDNWTERLSPAPIASESPEYSWKLPPYERQSPDYQWKYASIFVKNKDAT